MSEFWWCLKHKKVEPKAGCAWADRLGPYATEDEAAHALEKVAERNAKWDAEDWD